MDAVVCVVCATREPSAFDEGDGLLCVECATRWAICLDCDEPFLVAESVATVRCDGCLAAQRAPQRLAA
jgi:hypothetical protein